MSNIWKPVRGFPLYEISNMGEVRNSKTRKTLTLCIKKNTSCYKLQRKEVSLSKLMGENHPYEWIKYLEEGEEVKPLKEYSGYFITSLGRVWSMKHYKFLNPNNFRSYYYTTKIYDKQVRIHTLVGRAFLPEYREGLFILHKEETLPYPQINYVENLWVGTSADNSRDRERKGRGRWQK